MFKLDMDAIRETANEVRLMANPAKAANLANESARAAAFVSQLARLATLAISHGANDPEPPADSAAWRELAAAYNAHHVNCPTCQAAGRGPRYGMRCGTGAAMWISYQSTN